MVLDAIVHGVEAAQTSRRTIRTRSWDSVRLGLQMSESSVPQCRAHCVTPPSASPPPPPSTMATALPLCRQTTTTLPSTLERNPGIYDPPPALAALPLSFTRLHPPHPLHPRSLPRPSLSRPNICPQVRIRTRRSRRSLPRRPRALCVHRRTQPSHILDRTSPFSLPNQLGCS